MIQMLNLALQAAYIYSVSCMIMASPTFVKLLKHTSMQQLELKRWSNEIMLAEGQASG